MHEALIVSTARTPIGKAYRGAFDATTPQALAAHAIEDVLPCAALQQGHQGGNIARQAAFRSGLPATVGEMSLDRQCASGMMAIATAAKRGIHDGMDVVVGDGMGAAGLFEVL